MPSHNRHTRGFRLPRRGLTLDECEDAWAMAPETGRIAIADGASESLGAGTWARLLVEHFTQYPTNWPGWIAEVQPRWLEAVRPAVDAPPLPWYLEDRHHQGAFATFLGLQITEHGADVVAVGDSCLFHIRSDTLQRAFPLERSSEFGNTPWLVGSRTSPEEVPCQHALTCRVDLHEDDRLWLMTDALARWFLVETEAGRSPWRQLEAFLDRPEAEWSAWVTTLRNKREIRNDDTTLVAVRL